MVCVSMTRRSLIALAGSRILLRPIPTYGGEAAKPARLAIRGYDPVAYFTEGRPVQGSSELEYVWEETRWQFASAANLDLFRADPERYAPQYLGHCSLGIAQGEKSEVDPFAWEIVDGKLYLNFDQKAHRDWQKDQAANIKQADVNWPALRE
jgi:hypothetical protein